MEIIGRKMSELIIDSIWIGGIMFSAYLYLTYVVNGD